jgi:hypothetical protein
MAFPSKFNPKHYGWATPARSKTRNVPVPVPLPEKSGPERLTLDGFPGTGTGTGTCTGGGHA